LDNRLNKLITEVLDINYRSKTEIAAMILDAANGGVTKIKIMYKAMLSYNQ
jgi:predicted transcriptional regulator